MTMTLTGQARTSLKALLSKQPNWSGYCATLPPRNNSGVPANTGNMLTSEWIDAAQTFGIDMAALVTGVVRFTVAATPSGATPTLQTNPLSAAQTVAPTTGQAQAMPVSKTLGVEGEVYTQPIGPEAPVVEDDAGGDVVTGILAPLAGFLSPDITAKVAGNIEAALSSAAGKANRAAAAMTIEVPVYLDSETGQPVSKTDSIAASVGNTYVRQGNLGSVFKTRKANYKNMSCEIWSGDNSPDVDPHYEFDMDIVAVAFSTFDDNQYVWAGGHAGTGKTRFFMQLAALTGHGFTRIPLHGESEVAPLIGQDVPDGKGGYEYRHGALTQAIQRPGEYILIDEVSSATHAIHTCLQTLQDLGELLIPETGERIKVAPGVRFMVADNTLGFGDVTGAHQGKVPLDRATLDRYAQFVWFDYPKPEKEAQIIHNRTGLCLDACVRLVDFATKARVVVRGGGGSINYPVTIRRLFAWANGLVYGLDSATVFKTAILNCSGEDHPGLHEIEKAHLLGDGHSAITALARGETMPAAPVTKTPEGERASGTFDAVDED